MKDCPACGMRDVDGVVCPECGHGAEQLKAHKATCAERGCRRVGKYPHGDKRYCAEHKPDVRYVPPGSDRASPPPGTFEHLREILKRTALPKRPH